jgi:hypothetical protein
MLYWIFFNKIIGDEMKELKVVYEISEEDIQNVAEEMFNKKLRKNDLKKVSNKLGDFINWYDSIENTINYLNIDTKKYYAG